MSESDQPQPTPSSEGAPEGGEPEGQPQEATPVDLNSETAEQRQQRKLQSYQDDAERLRREHGQR